MRLLVASPEHDAVLRQLAASTSMPGWIRLAYAREPDFFHAVGVQGSFNQVILAMENDAAMGMGCRSIRPLYVNGRATAFGYLHGLRALPEARRVGGLARGYHFLRDLHQDGRAPAYLTTIVEDNQAAHALLTSGRAGLPTYRDCGRFLTYALSLRRRRNSRSPAGVTITRATAQSTDELIRFLETHGPRRQFFPCLAAKDFGTDLLRGLTPQDFLLAYNGAQLVGTLACWDQTAFKQNVVRGYTPLLALARPFVNAALRVAGCTPLPPPGRQLHLIYAAFVCIANDDPQILDALLERACAECRPTGAHFLAIGFHETDPLRAAVTSFLKFTYASRLYLVHWDDGREFLATLDPVRVPYLELATL